MVAIANVSAQEFNWGVKAGLNLANLSVEEDFDGNKSNLNFAFGFMTEYKFTDAVSLSADLLYSVQGDKYKDGDYMEKSNLSYLNIPILFNYYIVDRLAIKTGVQPGFLLGAKHIEKYDGEKDSYSDTEGMNTIDFSIPVGLSYDISEHIVIDARYNIGLTSTVKDYKYAKNNVFQFTVGYRF